MSALPPEIEEALAAVAVKQDPLTLQALDVLTATMDVFAADDSTDPQRRAVVEQGLTAVLEAGVVRALVDGTGSPADIAARFFRLKRLAALSAVLAQQRF